MVNCSDVLHRTLRIKFNIEPYKEMLRMMNGVDFMVSSKERKRGKNLGMGMLELSLDS